MSIALGSSAITTMYLGSSLVSAAYAGATSLLSGAIRLVATRGEVPLLQAQANTANKLRLTGRSRHKTGKVALTSIGAAWVNFYVDTSRLEQSIANAVTVRSHVEIVGAPTPVVQLTFAGANSGLMPSGSADFPSDQTPASAFGLASIPAGTVFFIVTEFTVATNEYCPAGPIPQDTGEGATYGDGAATQIGTAGSIVNQSGGAVTSALPLPAAVIGRTVAPIASAILFGDSLVFGFKDGGTGAVGGGGGESGGGIFPRGAWDIGSGYALPWARQGRTGTQASQAAMNYTKQSGVWKYATHFLCDLGTNDLNAGRTSAQTLADLQILWAAAKIAGVQKVEQMKIINRCSSSTDAWATVANQTVLTGFENAGTKKDPLNASIASNIGANGLDDFIDMNGQWSDSTVTDKIKAPNITGDGVHPLPAGAALMAADAATRFASWTAT